MPHTRQHPMRQLSAPEAAFIYSDSAHANANVSLLHIYDQTTAPTGVVRFKQILTHVESRLSRLPVLRQKILRVPLDLDNPYWVEDEDFDIEYHVRHIALPKPGDWRQFCIQAARIHARPLDLQRALWEMYVIEGLDSFLDLPVGSFAVLLKVHQSAFDVAHGSAITTLLHDFSPNPPPAPPPAPWFPQSSPGKLALMWRSGFRAASFPLRMMQPVSQGLSLMALTVKTFTDEFLQRSRDFPSTRFNTVVSSRRVFDTRRFALTDVARVRQLVRGATVHDVALAVCAGGLRCYLKLQGELPEDSLDAAAPTTLHNQDQHDTATGFSWTKITLQTHLSDPLQRLRTICASKDASTLPVHGSDWGPLANCRISTLLGPPKPLYLQGARLTYLSAIMPIADGMGLVFSVTSYNDMLVISFTGCYEQLPDPEVLAQCLRDSFQDYLALTQCKKPRRKPSA